MSWLRILFFAGCHDPAGPLFVCMKRSLHDGLGDRALDTREPALDTREPTAVAIALELMLLVLRVDPRAIRAQHAHMTSRIMLMEHAHALMAKCTGLRR
eukprot:1161817-Pelagomonas_calceolata.AAC.3